MESRLIKDDEYYKNEIKDRLKSLKEILEEASNQGYEGEIVIVYLGEARYLSIGAYEKMSLKTFKKNLL